MRWSGGEKWRDERYDEGGDGKNRGDGGGRNGDRVVTGSCATPGESPLSNLSPSENSVNVEALE